MKYKLNKELTYSMSKSDFAILIEIVNHIDEEENKYNVKVKGISINDYDEIEVSYIIEKN